MDNNNLIPTLDQWSVLWASGGPHGPGAIKVSINDSFAWSGSTHSLRVTLQSPDDHPLTGAAWLSSSRIGAAIPPPGRTPAQILKPERWKDDPVEPNQSEIEMLKALAELEQTDDEIMGLSIPIFEKHHWFELDDEVPDDIREHEVYLEIVDETDTVIAREGPKKPEREKIDWQKRINKPGDACHGLLPAECVYQKLDDIRKELCEQLSAWSVECILLSAWLKADPPAIHVACNMGRAGTMAQVDALTGEITVNGHEFMTGEWLIEVLLHEISHVIDYYTDKIEKYKAYKRAIKEGEEARDELTRLDRNPWRPTPEEWENARQRARLKLQNAHRITRECEKDYIKELLETECRALFYVLNYAELLGHPGKATRCIIDSIKHMMIQLIGIPRVRSQDVKDYVKPTLKDCLEKIRTWINKSENEAIKDAFKKDKANDENSWWEILEIFIRHFS